MKLKFSSFNFFFLLRKEWHKQDLLKKFLVHLTTIAVFMARVQATSSICKDGLTSEDFGKSSSGNSIVNKSIIACLISSQLLEHFGENEPRNPTPEECTISHHLFRTIQGWIEN